MDDVEIAEGALVSPYVTFTSNIKVGRCFHANLYSYVEHDCVIGDYVTFAPGVRCNGNIRIGDRAYIGRSEEHTSELQSLMRISHAVFCLKQKNNINDQHY